MFFLNINLKIEPLYIKDTIFQQTDQNLFFFCLFCPPILLYCFKKHFFFQIKIMKTILGRDWGELTKKGEGHEWGLHGPYDKVTYFWYYKGVTVCS